MILYNCIHHILKNGKKTLFIFTLACSTFLLQSQTFTCSNFTDPITITSIPNKPSLTSYSAMMGVNVKAWETPTSFSDYGSFIRTFHMMDGAGRDYANATPATFVPAACSDPIILPFSTTNCYACGTGNMIDLRPKYCEWKKNNIGNKVIASIETLPFPPRSFPDKNYSFADWGGSNQAVFDNARQYGKEFAKNYCPINSAHACVTDEVEITNEAWGNPGTAGIKALYRGFILGVNDYYTATNPTVSYVESSYTFPTTMNLSAWRIRLSSGAFQAFQTSSVWPNDYIGTLIPTDCWPYLEGASVHPYSFNFTNGTSSCSTDPTKINGIGSFLNKHPESRYSQFLTMLNFVNWKNANQPSKHLKVTEYGYDSQNVGQEPQGVYLVRSLLMMGRLNVKEASVYELLDVVNGGTGLYETSGLFTTANAQKPAYHALKRFKSKLTNKFFLKKLNTNEYDIDNMMAHVIGNADGTPTHIVVWRPIDITNNSNPSALTAALPIPNFPPQFTIDPAALVTRLGAEINDVTFAYSTIVSGANITVGPIPFMIPINPGSCKYDANGNLTGCVCSVVGGAITSTTQSNCTGYTPTVINSSTPASGGSGAITYSWEKSTTSSSTGFSVVAGQTGLTHNPTAITQTTWYRRGALQSPCTSPVYSNVIVKTVSNVTTAGNIGNNENECASYNPSIIASLSNASGGSGAISYQWQVSTTAPGTTGYSDIPGQTGITYDPNTITVSSWYRRGARTGSCAFVYTAAVAKTISGSCCPLSETWTRSAEVNSCRSYVLSVTPTANATNVVYTFANLPGNGYDPNGSSWTAGTYVFTAPSYVTTGSWTLPSVIAGTTYTLTLRFCFVDPDPCSTYSLATNGCNKINIPANCSAMPLWDPGLDQFVIGHDDSRAGGYKINLYPNPNNSGTLHFSLEKMIGLPAEVELQNMVGQTIIKIPIDKLAAVNELDISNLSKGNYLLNIKSNNYLIATEKFVIIDK